MAGHSGQVVKLGGDASFVAVKGDDTVKVGGGAATVASFHDSRAVVDGGAGSLVFLNRGGASTVVGGTGAETIFGGKGSGVYHAGSGTSVIVGGKGDDTLVGGTGVATLTGGAGKDVIEFIKGKSGGIDFVDHLTGADSVKLVGYTEADNKSVDEKLKAAALTGKDESLTLSDGTRLTFADVTSHHNIG